MDIHHLRVFASVFRHRSFSRASEELHLTQPTVSEHIRALEEELECSLFDRLGRSIIPTKEAETLHIHATDLIERAGRLRDAVRGADKEFAGELTLGASTIPGTYLLPRIIAEFKKRNPSVSFIVVESDSREIIDRLLSHKLLIGIVGTKPTAPQIQALPFVEEELVLIAPPGKAEKDEITLKQLVELPVVLREEGSGTRKEMERHLENKGITIDSLHVAGQFGSTDSVKQAVKAGLGVSIISRLAVEEELRHRTLRQLRIRGVEMKRRFYIATHKKRTLPLSYSAFLAYLKDCR